MMFWNHNMGGWGWAGMGVGMVLFWGLLIAGIVALVAYLTGDRHDRQIPRERISPDQVLAARVARGEIGEADYRERLAVLRNHAQ